MPPQLLAGDAMPGYKVETSCVPICRESPGLMLGDGGARFETFFWGGGGPKPDGRGPGREQDGIVQMMDGVRHNRETEREQCIRRHHLFYLEPRHVRHAALAAAVLPAVPAAADKRERYQRRKRFIPSQLFRAHLLGQSLSWFPMVVMYGTLDANGSKEKNLNFKNFNQNFISDGLFQTWSLSALIPARLLLESMRSIEHSSHISHLASVPIAQVTGELLCA